MNYRIDDMSAEVVKFHCSPEKIHVLKQKDQLMISMKEKRCFEGFTEGTIEFMPTYKYDLQTDTYDTRYATRTLALHHIIIPGS